MPETENIALGISFFVIAGMGVGIKVLWTALHASMEREKAALREGIEIDRSYTAQVDSMSAVISSIQRTQHAAAKAARAGFDAIESAMEKGFARVITEIQK